MFFIMFNLFYSGRKTEINLSTENSEEKVSGIEEKEPEKKAGEIAAVEPQKPNESNVADKTEKKVKNDSSGAEESNDKKTESAATIIKRLIDWGFQKVSSRDIDTIIIHSSYDAIGSDPFSVEGILKEYEDYGVSAHYLIDRKGRIYQLVENVNIAYHAGVAKTPDSRSNVNSFSIGIELVNTKKDDFTKEQYASLNALLGDLKKKYKIKYVLGHDQIAPERKDDPWNFDWKKVE